MLQRLGCDQEHRPWSQSQAWAHLTLQGFGLLEKWPPLLHMNGILSYKPHRMQQQIPTQTLTVLTIIRKILQSPAFHLV